MKKVLLLSFLCFAFSPVYSNDDPVLFAIQDVPPYLYPEGDTYGGPIFNVLAELEKDLGFEAKYELLTWARIISMGKAGQEIVLVRHSMVPDREPFLNEILLGYKVRKLSYIRKRNAPDASSFEELQNFRVGARNKAFYSIEFNGSDFQKVLVDRDDQLFRMLTADRIDFAVTYDVNESRELALKSGFNFDEDFELASYQEIFLNGRFLSIPYNTKLNEHWFAKINCQVFEYRQAGKVTAWFEANDVQPYIQNFEEPASLAQEAACQP